MKVYWSPQQAKLAARFIAENNSYVDYSADYIEETIYDIVRDVADKILLGDISELYIRGTLGFHVIACVMGSGKYQIDVWVDPSVSKERSWVRL